MMEQLHCCDLVTTASLVRTGCATGREVGVWVGRLLMLKKVYQGITREQG